jgi:hypothetical protein
MAARVVARVLSVAKRGASIREQPSTVTQACRAPLPVPKGQNFAVGPVSLALDAGPSRSRCSQYGHSSRGAVAAGAAWLWLSLGAV